MPDTNTIPLWMLGEDLHDVTLTPLLVNAGTGEFTPSTPLVFTNVVMSVRLEDDLDQEDIRPVNRRQKNFVTTGEGMGATLVELRQRNVPGVLAAVRMGATEYWRISVTEGVETWVVDVIRAGIRGGISAHGANTLEMPFRPIDNGNDENPTYDDGS
jgi:hypothetical protein